jgi:hypothetical protein
MLRSEKNNAAIGTDAEDSFRALYGGDPEAFYEHGHWWITNRDTGAQYDAVDASGPGSCAGWGFEQVSGPDE